jgi:hypothetical protein
MLLPVVSQSQALQINRTISWAKHLSKIDTATNAITFDGAYCADRQSLPLWNETFYDNGLSENVTIDNCTFLVLSDAEKLVFSANKIDLPPSIVPVITKVTSRKQTGILVEIMPFIHDLATNQILKLSSFTLNFAESDKPEAITSKTYASSSVLSQGSWYKLAVTQTGIYRLDYNDLVAMGINPATINSGKIGIFGRGGTMLPEPNNQPRADDLPEITIEITGQGDGSFDQGDHIVFYAQGPTSWQYNNMKQMWEHTPHLYADTISYFLTPDQGTGKRILAKASSAETETDIVDSYDFYATFDENNFNLVKSGRQWFSQVFDVITSRSYSFDIPALASGNEVKVRSVTAAKSINASSFELSVGSQAWTVSHSPISTSDGSAVATGAVYYKTLQSVSLPLKVDVRYIKTSTSAAGYLDFLDINARCALKFSSGQLHFRDSRSFGSGRTALYRVTSAAGKAKIWDVTNPLTIFAINANTDGNDLVFKLPADTIRQFVAYDESQFLKPVFVHKIQNQNLHATTGVDMVIIAPQLFMAQAVRLATFHANATNLNVLVLDPTTIYNEFASGTVDITAIRDFMKMLYDRAATDKMPKYLLLFGDGSYDYKDKIASNTNFIPTWQSVESFDPIHSIATDDYFGILDDNEGKSYSDVIDMGIGRLPVANALEAEQAVDKIIHYSVASPENMSDWRDMVTFVADDEDDEHVEHSEILANDLNTNYPEMNIDKVYLDSYIQVASSSGNRYPDVNKAITQRVEKGSLILNYIGHGGETGWAHEQVLTVNEINNWSNFDNMPVFVTATCEFSRFDDPGRRAAGEYVLTNPKGGGIALFTTTRPTFGTPNFELNKKFFQYAMSKPDGQRLRMGDIIMNSKRDKGSNENGRKYVLLGDPALQIAFPALNVVTTKFNGHAPGSNADTLKAYMEVSIEGIIADANGNIVSDFNGTIYPTVFDKAVTQKTLANDGGTIFSYLLRKNLLYKGTVKVENGHFSFTFIVPKDIAYQYDTGKISYHATNGVSDAVGFYTNVIVGGSTDVEVIDTQGPDISLYMNNKLFQDGGITDQNAKLLALVSDENGINTVGNGIGHDITAVLDGNTSEPYILNDFYQSDINTFKSGYIWFPFSMLATGEHTINLKVWDIFNNSSEAEIHFTVVPSGDFVISKTYSYPNPFREYTDIVFEHNQQGVDFDVRAEIYSLSGQLVRVIEQTSAQSGSVSTPIRWDGLRENGSRMGNGLYIYNLIVHASNGLDSQVSGRLVLQK